MEQLDFTLDGISALSVGIRLQKRIEISPLIPRIETISIPGKSGDYHYHDGSFENRTATAVCFALSDDVAAQMETINNFLFPKKNDIPTIAVRTLVCNGYSYQAIITNAAEFAPRMMKLNPFKIIFNIQPFGILVTAEEGKS